MPSHAIYTRNNVRPPRVTIADEEYQFRSLLELRFALLLQFLLEAKEIRHWGYEVDTLTFYNYRNGPHKYTPDFTVLETDSRVIIYECMAYLTTQYCSKFRRVLAQARDLRITAVMAKPDRNKKRQPIYAKAIESGLISHVWYAGKDFKRLGIIAQAKAMIEERDT